MCKKMFNQAAVGAGMLVLGAWILTDAALTAVFGETIKEQAYSAFWKGRGSKN